MVPATNGIQTILMWTIEIPLTDLDWIKTQK